MQNHRMPQDSQSDPNPAAELIRQKIAGLYQDEPDIKEEVQVISDGSTTSKTRSEHQQFIYDLTHSGKSMVEIQTAWHEYYTNLTDDQKHIVWNEFYSAHAHASKAKKTAPLAAPVSGGSAQPLPGEHRNSSIARFKQIGEIRNKIVTSPIAKKTRGNTHVRSLLFGLSMGAVTIGVLLFGFFNERVIAPFITPSRTVTNTPIISDSTASAGPEPRVIIPKINVEIPVVFDEPSVQEEAVQTALERGVVHYASTAQPGQNGNVVIVGHSSNNIFNKGQYKFAFVLLSKLENNDTFTLQKDGQRFTYRIYEKKIVKPTDVSVLNAQAKPASATLITCDPPGTSINRLVVIGEQISPDPSINTTTASTPVDSKTTEIIPGNAPSLWQRFFGG